MKNLNALFFFAIVLASLNTEASLRFSSYNIRNFDYDERSNTPTNKKHLVQILDQIKADLVAVQEINNSDEFDRMIDKNYNGKLESVLSFCGGAHDQKLGFIYNTNKLKLIKFEEDSRVSNPSSPNQSNCNNGSRPLAIGTFKMIDTNEKLVAISLHLKSGGRQSNIDKRFKQHKLINDVVNEYRASGIKNIVIMGDFNSTEYIVKGETKNRFERSVSRMGLTDTTRKISCSSYWWGGAQDARQYPSILDHILISPSLIGKKATKVELYGHCKKHSCRVTPESQMGVSFDEVSDHCPIVTEIQ